MMRTRIQVTESGQVVKLVDLPEFALTVQYDDDPVVQEADLSDVPLSEISAVIEGLVSDAINDKMAVEEQ